MLNGKEIKKLIEKQGLIKDYIDLKTQLTPNGFDITVSEISEFKSKGALDFSNSERIVPKGKKIITDKINKKDKFGWWNLKPGTYKVKTNESFNMPNNLIAVSFPRSSLLRMGAMVYTGVWDAGFQGKAEFILIVGNTNGIKIKKNARICQLIFSPINKVGEGYNGVWQNLK